MKKCSKMLALGMALSLAFGVTAFAADSPTVGSADLGGRIEVTPTGLEEDQTLEIGGTASTNENEAKAEIAKDAVKTEIANKVSVGSGKKAVVKEVVAAFNVDVKENGAVVSISNPVTLTFNGAWFVAGKKYAVLHKNGDTWEVLSATTTADGVTATFTSLSPVAIVEVAEEAVNTTTPSNPSTPSNPAPAQNEAPKSPQTGGVVSAVELMALISLAGSAVCARKVRSNKQ